MKKYFEGLTEEKAIKTRYKELAKQYHPDRGGDAEIMKAINTQFEAVMRGAYQRAGKSMSEMDDLWADDKIMCKKLHEILILEGIEIEICGKWIWITGKTKIHRDKLKSAGFFWACKKEAWYWREQQARSFNRKPMSFEEIRTRHGSTTVQRPSRAMVA